jgi:hypothetical protein
VSYGGAGGVAVQVISDLRRARAQRLEAGVRHARQVGVDGLAGGDELDPVAGRDDQRLADDGRGAQLAQQFRHGFGRQGDGFAHPNRRGVMRQTHDDDHAAAPLTA